MDLKSSGRVARSAAHRDVATNRADWHRLHQPFSSL